MVEDIRIKTTFPWHRKVRRLTRELGQDSTGYLLRLFIRTAMTRPDGCLSGMDAVDIACDAEWAGDPAAFLDALRLCGWVDMDAEGVFWLHDWAEHQAWVVREPLRREAGRKGASARWQGRSMEGASAGEGVPAAEKMPEVGAKISKDVPPAYEPDAERIRTGCGSHAEGMRPAMPLSSPSPKYKNTPPERSKDLSSPGGGERQLAKRFVPPTVEEIAAYCAERGNGLDAQAIHDHYTANGWKVGKNPMRDWRAAVRTWESRRRQDARERAASTAASPAAKLLAQGNEAGGQPQ